MQMQISDIKCQVFTMNDGQDDTDSDFHLSGSANLSA